MAVVWCNKRRWSISLSSNLCSVTGWQSWVCHLWKTNNQLLYNLQVRSDRQTSAIKASPCLKNANLCSAWGNPCPCVSFYEKLHFIPKLHLLRLFSLHFFCFFLYVCRFQRIVDYHFYFLIIQWYLSTQLFWKILHTWHNLTWTFCLGAHHLFSTQHAR